MKLESGLDFFEFVSDVRQQRPAVFPCGHSDGLLDRILPVRQGVQGVGTRQGQVIDILEGSGKFR